MNALLENPTVSVSSVSRAVDRSPLDITDEELMQRIQQQDSTALGILHDRYSGLMKGLIMKVLHDDAASDDLLQEVFIELWNRAGSYSQEKGKPLGWIITLARRRSIDRLRKRDTYCRVEDRFAEQTRNQAHDWVAHVEEDVAQSEMRTFLTRALATLPAAQREAIEAAYFKGMSQREIAASTGIPLGTIKTRLELGLRKLSEDLHGLEDLL
ncbi:MAG: polymerase, sigma-24 subunit, subfamily [Chthoniobacteraceae bacterium]|nr:polymerase, sigma-24 subunit, subfamily [Chthoniobacteraceae bacterium]